ncbi:MAG: addiction module antidote protein, HigA family, partial [Acetivibrio sp.]
TRADRFARNALIPLNEFKHFTTAGDFSLDAIRKFANKCGVNTFIVIGRLMKEELIGWECYSKERIRYKWA